MNGASSVEPLTTYIKVGSKSQLARSDSAAGEPRWVGRHRSGPRQGNIPACLAAAALSRLMKLCGVRAWRRWWGGGGLDAGGGLRY